MTLVALFAMTTGAWADDAVLLTTITATGTEQASYSTANVATVSFSNLPDNSSSYTANWGWWGYGWSATVNAAEGYTITKCIFYDDKDRTATDSEAPFVVETTEEDKTPKVNGTPILADTSKGIKKIDVYGYATPAPAGTALNPDATRKVWTLDAMPAGNVELQVAYFPGMLVKPTSLVGGTMEIEGVNDTDLPEGFEKDDAGNIYVEAGKKFTVKAVPATGYHLVGWSDDATIKDLEREFTMPDDGSDFTVTATFSDEFELTFDDVNFKTNKNITVKVGDADKTLDQDGKLSVKAGQTVTLTAKQGYKFRSVEAKKAVKPAAKTTDLSTLTADYEAQDGETLKGTLGGNYKITIADKATVTLDGVNINSTNSAGITCEGGATIILSGTNAVTGAQNYPGIQAGSTGTTLTIQGDGSLTATGGSSGAGIGGGYQIACGNITISGGTVTATGKANGAGIGSGQNASCGNITISGGTVTATGGFAGAGIGSGYGSGAMCGDITITSGVTSVTATKGSGSGGNAANSIGKGGGTSSCGTVTIGGTVTGNISTSPYTYQP